MRLHSFTPKMSTQNTLDTFEEDNDFLQKKKKKKGSEKNLKTSFTNFLISSYIVYKNFRHS